MTTTAIRKMNNADLQIEEEIERHHQIVEDEGRTLHERRLALKMISELVKRRSACVVQQIEQQMGLIKCN